MGRAAAELVGSFDSVTTAESAGWYKPDPRTYGAALEQLGLEPGDEVTIRKRRFGGYRLVTPSGKGYGVKRVR